VGGARAGGHTCIVADAIVTRLIRCNLASDITHMKLFKKLTLL